MNDLQSIISQLEQQKAAIDKALAALREVSGETMARGPWKPKGTSKKAASGDGRQRQIEAMRAYWATKKAGTKKVAAKKVAKRTSSTAGRKALSENMKRMWASKRAG